MKIRPLIGRRIRIGRRVHMNQPLVKISSPSELVKYFVVLML